MTMRAIWQKDWKRPQWTQFRNDDDDGDDDDENDEYLVDKVVMGVTSAQVAWEELPLDLREKERQQQQQQELEEEEEDSYMLSVTLLGTEGQEAEAQDDDERKPAASEILLEVVRMSSNGDQGDGKENQIILSRRLQWPEILGDEKDDGDKKEEEEEYSASSSMISSVWSEFLGGILLPSNNNTLLGTTSRTLPKQGVVAATLCRRRRERTDQLATEALDTLLHMGLGMEELLEPLATPVGTDLQQPQKQQQQQQQKQQPKDDQVTNTTNENDTSINEVAEEGDEEEGGDGSIPSMDLFLACITTKGMVAIYDPWTLLVPSSTASKQQQQQQQQQLMLQQQHPALQPFSSFSNHDEWDQGIATLFFGQEMLSTLQNNYLPLSEPLSTISLSLLEQQQKSSRRKRQEERSRFKKKKKKKTTTTKNQLGFRMPDVGLLWNPLVEPATVPHRTIHNKVTDVCVAGESYLVVLGNGIQVYHNNKNIQESSDDDDDDDDGDDDEDNDEKKDPSNEVIEEEEKINDKDTDAQNTVDENHNEDDHDESPWDLARMQEEEDRQRVEEQAATTSPYQGGEKENEDVVLVEGADDPLWTETAPTTTVPSSTAEMPTQTPSPTTTPTTTPISPLAAKEKQLRRKGGFVTFCSLAHWSETRTLFLPFVPKSVSYVRNYQSMEMVLVVGEKEAVAIRLDASYRPVPLLVGGEGRPTQSEAMASSSSTRMDLEAHASADAVGEGTKNTSDKMMVRRFQTLPLHLSGGNYLATSGGDGDGDGRLLCASSPGVEPPALLQWYSNRQEGLLLHQTLQGLNPQGFIETGHAPGHTAKIQLSMFFQLGEGFEIPSTKSKDDVWAYLGQGWSLLGANQRIFFVCWEGATASRGVSFFKELDASPLVPISMIAHLSNVLPLPNEVSSLASQDTSTLPLPFASESYERLLEDYADNNILLDALESISGLSYRDNASNFSNSNPNDADTIPIPWTSSADNIIAVSVPQTPTPQKSFSHREKSSRLLRQCSSWTQLENSSDNRKLLERQVPVVSLRFGTSSAAQHVLTLRQLVVYNGAGSPFQQVLSWLCNQQDYFGAASLALDLLHDADSLYHLWKHSAKVDEEDEQTKLDGLLDGIIPIGGIDDEEKQRATFIHLADMTVGCLIKGGLGMSKTLESFLNRNEYYDPARACLMLVAATANALSDDGQAVSSVVGAEVANPSKDDLLWPVRSLLEIGVSRDYLNIALVLLNVTVPDELRRRPRQASLSIPEMELTKKLVTLIVASDPRAIDFLLALVDEESRTRYWQSLNHETRLVLSLIEIRHKRPLLRHEEVRSWAREELHKCLKNEKSGGRNVLEVMPTSWLQDLCAACLSNAGCDLEGLAIDVASLSAMAQPESPSFRDSIRNDHMFADFVLHQVEIIETRNSLIPVPGSGGLDFDLLIPALLLLQSRQSKWQENGDYASTQSLLDAACYLAGRQTVEEPLYTFDGATVMRQCALAGNVRAGANLIGGKNGFVLSCCDILMVELQISMEDAEEFFLNDKLSTRIMKDSSFYKQSRFELSDSHRWLLWLLHEYVLSIRTYGEFETVHLRGRVDPVFCARSIFRAWLCLTYSDKENGSAWLVRWLRTRLGILEDRQISEHRLACAALTRALVWPSDSEINAAEAVESGQMLGNVLKMESKFLVQLAQSCCGLVESVPASVAEDVIIMAETSKDTSTNMSMVLDRLHSDVLV